MGLKEFIKTLAKEIDRSGIDYMIIGGQAVLIYGEPRLTKDIDITLGTGLEGYEKVLEIINNLKLKILPKNPLKFVKQTLVLPVLHSDSGIRIDFIFSYSEYEKNALKRVKKVKIDGITVKYASLEDLIIQKIISGRERDIEDVKGILLKNKKLNERYIKKWLREFERVINKKLVEKFEELKRGIHRK